MMILVFIDALNTFSTFERAIQRFELFRARLQLFGFIGELTRQNLGCPNDLKFCEDRFSHMEIPNLNLV